MTSKKISIAILGSTGSVGKTALDIIKKNTDKFSVDLLSCNKNKKLIIQQINLFQPKYVLVSNKNLFLNLKKIKFKRKVVIYNDLTNLKKKKLKKFDKTVLSISSINGLKFGFFFIEISKEILIANKETIVCGGNLLISKAKKFGCNIKSIDSEHYSISNIINKNNNKQIYKVYLTASGGPFLKKSFKYFKKIDYKKALSHPKWKMGKKISIDSATMANKVLEMIEAIYLFKLSPEMIKVKIHKESLVHAAIIFKNGLVKFIAHNTSMKIPIRNSLINNNNYSEEVFFYNKNDFIFTFEEKSLKKFKLINLGYKILKLGPKAYIIFNVINDLLVDSYLKRKIFFYEIIDKLIKVFNDKQLLSYCNQKKIKCTDDIYKTINFAKTYAKKI